MWTIIWSLAEIVANNEINDNNKNKQIAGDSNGHADVAVQFGTHPPMDLITGFTRSHWMPPLGECLHRIAPAAAKVIDFGCKHKSLTKHNF
jgi:hypothetical protein